MKPQSGEIYLVTRSDWDDYEVLAAFSSLEKAQAYVGEFTRMYSGEAPKIETLVIDPPRHQLGPAHEVSIDVNGRVLTDAVVTDKTPSSPAEQLRFGNSWRFVGYGLTAEEAHQSAEELRDKTVIEPEPEPSPPKYGSRVEGLGRSDEIAKTEE